MTSKQALLCIVLTGYISVLEVYMSVKNASKFLCVKGGHQYIRVVHILQVYSYKELTASPTHCPSVILL